VKAKKNQPFGLARVRGVNNGRDDPEYKECKEKHQDVIYEIIVEDHTRLLFGVYIENNARTGLMQGAIDRLGFFRGFSIPTGSQDGVQ
jgi:hypothetical protein